MPAKSLIAHSFINNEQEELAHIEYYLVELDSNAEEPGRYEIEVEQTSGISEDRATCQVTCSRKEAVALAEMLAKKSVFPSTLIECIEELTDQ